MIERLNPVLIVDPARGFRRLLASQFEARGDTVREAETLQQGREWMGAHPETALVVVATALDDGSGFDLAEELKQSRAAQIRVVIVGHAIAPEDRWRAAQVAGDGCLEKPVGVHEIVAALKRNNSPDFVERAERRPLREPIELRHAGDATRLPRPTPLRCWLRDLSTAGAFLETQGPIAPRTPLELVLELEGEHRAIEATVVREQPPSWAGPGGVGVRFGSLDASTRLALGRLVGEARALTGN